MDIKVSLVHSIHVTSKEQLTCDVERWVVMSTSQPRSYQQGKKLSMYDSAYQNKLVYAPKFSSLYGF